MPKPGNVIPIAFYQRADVLEISRELLGKFLYTRLNGILTGGMIVETEAYKAPEDKASHAWNNKRTPRTEPFYKAGGIAYVYLCYGIHHLFNIVTHLENHPHAILIRAIEPITGVDSMLQRRNKTKLDKTLSSGPGALSQALGITIAHNQCPLQGPEIWLEDRRIRISQKQIVATPRIGVAYAEEYASKPWRYFIKDNPWVSK